MEEDSLTVLGLWEQMSSGVVELMNDASQKLDDFFKNPESVMIILNIAQNCPDIKIKGFSVVNLYRLLQRHHNGLPPDVFPTISQQIMELLHSKIDMNSKLILCDVLVKYYTLGILNFEVLFSSSTQMLQSEDRSIVPVGVYLIAHLIDQKHLTSFSIELIQFLINTCLQNLQNPANFGVSSFDLFRISYEFLHTLLDIFILDENIFALFQPVTEYLQKTYQIVYGPNGIGSPNDNEQEVQIKLSKYFDLLSGLVATEPNYFAENFAPIIPEINSNLINKGFSISIRNASLILLNAVSECLPDLFGDIFIYVRNTALLAIELFEENENLQSIYEPKEIYENICKNFYDLEPAEIFGKFVPNISDLESMENMGAFIAIFMILDSIQPYCLEAIIESFDSVQSLFIKGISSSNPYVIEIISKLISNLCKADDSIACTILSTCEPGLIHFASNDFVVETLRDIYDRSGNEPSDSNASFGCLIEQITSSQDKYHIENVVECLGYLVLTCQSDLNAYFEQIHPILAQLLATRDTACCASAIFCSSTFANKSANLVKNDIPQIVEVIINGIPEKDTKFIQYSATLISNFVDIYPQSFAQFCPRVLTSLISIINDKEFYYQTKNKSIEEQEVNEIGDTEDNPQDVIDKQNILELYSAMRDDVFAAIATIFGSFPNELADQSDMIAQIIMSSCYGNTFGEEEDREEMLINLSGFYKSLTEVIPGFLKIGKDPDNLIRFFFDSRKKMHYFDIDITDAVSFWDSLKIIISKCGPPFITKYGEEILKIVAETYEDRKMWKIYSQNMKKFVLRKEFISPITTLVGRFFHDFGGDGWLAEANYSPAPFAQKGVELMQRIMQTTKSAAAQASSAIAYIIVACGNDAQFDGLAESVLKTVFPDLINSKIGENRESAYDTISILLYSQNRVALSMLNNQEVIQRILESTQEVISNEDSYKLSLATSAAILWCGIVMAFNVEVPREALDIVLNLIPPPPYTSMLEFVAQFAVYAAERWPDVFGAESMMLVGISIFASTNNYIRNVKIDYMRIIANVLKNTPQERIEEEVKSDENSMMTIQAHVEQVLSLA